MRSVCTNGNRSRISWTHCERQAQSSGADGENTDETIKKITSLIDMRDKAGNILENAILLAYNRDSAV